MTSLGAVVRSSAETVVAAAVVATAIESASVGHQESLRVRQMHCTDLELLPLGTETAPIEESVD